MTLSCADPDRPKPGRSAEWVGDPNPGIVPAVAHVLGEDLGAAHMVALQVADAAMILALGDVARRGDAKELAADEARIERADLGRSAQN